MSRRTERVSEAIREVVSEAVLFELKDPRVQGVTVTGAQVTGDLRNAKVFVSIMGEEVQRRLAMAGLKNARGFLQRKVADRLDTRYTPILTIVEDDSVKKSLEMSRLLREVLPPQELPPLEDTLETDEVDADDEDDNDAAEGPSS